MDFRDLKRSISSTINLGGGSGEKKQSKEELMLQIIEGQEQKMAVYEKEIEKFKREEFKFEGKLVRFGKIKADNKRYKDMCRTLKNNNDSLEEEIQELKRVQAESSIVYEKLKKLEEIVKEKEKSEVRFSENNRMLKNRMRIAREEIIKRKRVEEELRRNLESEKEKARKLPQQFEVKLKKIEKREEELKGRVDTLVKRLQVEVEGKERLEQDLNISTEESIRMKRLNGKLEKVIEKQKLKISRLRNAYYGPRKSEKTVFHYKPDEVSKGQLIGKGSYGKVFKGILKRRVVQENVAVKRVPYKTIRTKEEIIEEFRKQFRLNDKAVVSTLGYIEYDIKTKDQLGEIGIIMEEMDGNLRDFVKENILTLGQKFELLIKMAEVVRLLHLSKPDPIIHRDIKGANFLYDSDGNVIRICDFGLAKPISGDHNTKVQNKNGSLISFAQTVDEKQVGTIRFMAPEILNRLGNKNLEYSRESDVYSLGITFWEILFEETPFVDISKERTQYLFYLVPENKKRPNLMLYEDEFTQDGKLPPELVEVLEWCWHHDRTKRPSADEIIGWFEDKEMDLCDYEDEYFPPKNIQEEKRKKFFDKRSPRITKKEKKKKSDNDIIKEKDEDDRESEEEEDITVRDRERTERLRRIRLEEREKKRRQKTEELREKKEEERKKRRKREMMIKRKKADERKKKAEVFAKKMELEKKRKEEEIRKRKEAREIARLLEEQQKKNLEEDGN